MKKLYWVGFLKDLGLSLIELPIHIIVVLLACFVNLYDEIKAAYHNNKR